MASKNSSASTQMLQADGRECLCIASQTAIHVAAIMHGFASVIFLINVIMIVYLFKHLPICVYLLRRHCRYHKYFWYYPSYCCIDNTGCSYWKLHAAGIGCDSCLFFDCPNTTRVGRQHWWTIKKVGWRSWRPTAVQGLWRSYSFQSSEEF